MCDFGMAWMGKCKKENVPGEHFCEEHLGKKCVVCGDKAKHHVIWGIQY